VNDDYYLTRAQRMAIFGGLIVSNLYWASTTPNASPFAVVLNAASTVASGLMFYRAYIEEEI